MILRTTFCGKSLVVPAAGGSPKQEKNLHPFGKKKNVTQGGSLDSAVTKLKKVSGTKGRGEGS